MSYVERDRYERYLQELEKDRDKLAVMEGVFFHCFRLVELEIGRVKAVLDPETVPPGTESDSLLGTPAKVAKLAEETDAAAAEDDLIWDPNESAVDKLRRLKEGQQMIERVAPNVVRIFEKVFLPQRQYPTIKYPGRIIGPGGSTVKEVNNLTGCKLLVRGKGSFKIPHQEDSMKTVAGFEHLEEEMHVLIEASGTENEANSKLQYAKQIVLEIIPPEANPPEVLQKYATWGRFQFGPPQYHGQMPPQQMGFQGGVHHQGYPMANHAHQMGFNQGGAPHFMGGPHSVPPYGAPPPGQQQFGSQQFGSQQFGPQQFGPQQFGPQQYGGQPYGYAQSPVQQYAPVLPPQLAVTLPSLPAISQSTVSRLPPLPPGVDPPKARKIDLPQPKIVTSSLVEQNNDKAKKNGPDASNVHVSSLPSQSYFSDYGNSQSAEPRSVIPVTQPAALVGIDVNITQEDN